MDVDNTNVNDNDNDDDDDDDDNNDRDNDAVNDNDDDDVNADNADNAASVASFPFSKKKTLVRHFFVPRTSGSVQISRILRLRDLCPRDQAHKS